MTSHKNIIDIILSVVDNYGDMWFASELVDGWYRQFWGDTTFVIWTDDIMRTKDFFYHVGTHCPEIYGVHDFWKKRLSKIALSLLHAPIPKSTLFDKKSLVLRVDYPTFDNVWSMQTWVEHIYSQENHQIIEIVPSPLTGSAWLLPIEHQQLSRSIVASLIQKYTDKNIDINKQWISIFAYPDTIDRIDFLSFPEDAYIFNFSWHMPSRQSTINFPLIPRNVFHQILLASNWSIVRGDMTGMMMLQSWVPFLWDIYRDIGWVHHEMSDAFLDYIWATGSYRRTHHHINTQFSQITYMDCIWWIHSMNISCEKTPNLLLTLKKYIDRFYFCL